MIQPKELKRLASDKNNEFRSLVNKLKRKKPKNLDEIVFDLHNRAFSEIDCLDCGNCCKTISPFLTDKDIQRIAAFLKIKPTELVEKYLYIDNENDYVFKSAPCPFLGSDNYCSIYDQRPKACKDYPHTDRKRFVQILDLSLKNTITCPAVFEVFEGLKNSTWK